MWFSKAREVKFNRGENFRLRAGMALFIGSMVMAATALAAGRLSTGGLWPDWVTLLGIIAFALLSSVAFAVKLFGDAQSRQMLEKNTAMLTEIAAGQGEIIRLLKAGAPAGAAAAGVQPSAAARANGRGGDNDSDGRTGHPASFNPGGAPEWKK